MPGAKSRAKQMQVIPAHNETLTLKALGVSPDGIWIHNQGTIHYVNDALVKMLGYSSSDELVGRSIHEFFPPEEQAALRDRVKMTSAESRPVTTLATRLRRDGSRIPVEITAAAYVQDGKPWNIAIARDITERQRTQAALQESETRFRTIVEQAGDGFELYDEQGRFIDVNKAACEQLGYSREELLQLTVYDLDPEMTREWYLRGFGLPASAPPETFEAMRRRKDGTIFPVEVTRSIVQVGPRRQAFSLVRDITRRKRAETVTAQLAAIVESSNDAILSRALDHTVLSWNAAAERLFGYSAAEAVGRHLPELIVPPDRWGEVERNGAPSDQVNAVINLDRVRRTKDGRLIDVSLSQAPIKNILGKTVGVSMTFRDITERKRAELALREAEEQFRSLAAMSSDFYWQTDAEHRLLARGPGSKGTNVSTFDNNAQVGLRRWEIPYLSPNEASWQAHRAVLDAHRPFRGFELSRLGSDGTEQHISLSGDPVFDSSGAFRGYRGVGTNISERKRAEAELREAHDELERKARDLERSNEELQQFAYVASHDLQEPLRMISSYTQLLERRYTDKLDKDAKEFMAFIVDGAARMKQLIEDLLAYSRVGMRGHEFKSVEGEAALAKALTNLRGAIESNGASITHDPLPTVTADEPQLVQLLQNLIGNALKFKGTETPRVHVRAEEREDRWVFSVKDNGIGIDPQYFQRVFTMFQRLHSKDEYPGTGIGLAICKKIVDRHGGRIWVESQLGKGANFVFTLPKNAGLAEETLDWESTKGILP
jgi:PAS domain S-box-containing protein